MFEGRSVSAFQAARMRPVPPYFLCPGHDPDGKVCNARLTLRAVDSKVVKPYFGAMGSYPHIEGCDVACPEAAQAVPARSDCETVARTAHTGPVLIALKSTQDNGSAPRVPTREDPNAAQDRAHAVPRPGGGDHRPQLQRMNLFSLMKRYQSGAFDEDARIKMPDGREMLVEQAICPINAFDPELVPAGAGPIERVFWGQLTGQGVFTSVGGCHLRIVPAPGRSWRQTPSLLLKERDFAPVLAQLGLRVNEHMPALAGRFIVAYGRYISRGDFSRIDPLDLSLLEIAPPLRK